MRNTYIAVIAEENGKRYAYGIKASTMLNLVAMLKDHKHLVAGNVCETKKHMVELVNNWNEGFRQNGCYMFDDEPLF